MARSASGSPRPVPFVFGCEIEVEDSRKVFLRYSWAFVAHEDFGKAVSAEPR